MGILLSVILLILFLALLAFLLTPISLRFESTQRYMSIKWMGISFERKFREWRSREPGRKTEEKRRSIKAIGLRL